MKRISIGNGKITASNIALGCFRMHILTVKEAEVLIRTALEQGIDFFDHADIYGDGICEEIFAEALGLKPDLRDKILIQSKCGIRNASYDFSREHILRSVDGSLRRLKNRLSRCSSASPPGCADRTGGGCGDLQGSARKRKSQAFRCQQS